MTAILSNTAASDVLAKMIGANITPVYDKEFWRKNAYGRKSVFELFFVDVSAKTLQVAPG